MMTHPSPLKLCLTTIAMFVLSACGSSGGDDAPSTQSAKTPPASNSSNTNTTVTPKKEDYVAVVNQALAEARAAKEKADMAVKAGDVEAARKAMTEAAAALAKANTVNNTAFNDKDTNSAVVFATAKEVESVFKSLSDVVNKAQAAADQNAAQDQANKSIAVSPVPANHGKSNVGYKHVIKNNSDFILDNVKKKANNESNTGLLMREQNPNEELDNLVVASLPNKAKGVDDLFYLEDTDLRSADVATPITPTSTNPVANKVAIKNVYLAGVDEHYTQNKRTSRTIGKDLEWDTKTMTQGNGSAQALIYNKGQNIYLYTGKDETGLKDSGLTNARILLGADQEGRPVTVGFTDPNAVVNRDGTVMAAFGAKTVFTKPTDPYTPVKYTNDAYAQAESLTQDSANLPLLNSGLQYVQYGRVTSQLSGRALTEFSKGLNTTGFDNTHLAAFGTYGAKGTENHYFSRGIHNTTSDQLAGLSKYYGTPKLVYEGHAEAYGVNNAFSRADKNNHVPTALRSTTQEFLMSGNHVRANVDLNTKLVDGNVYNRWGLVRNNRIDDTFQVVETPLVGFEGKLADNGNIAGTATNFTQGNAPGILSATIFGPKGEEMGGTIVSDNPAKVQWGVAFGATNINSPATTVLKPGNSSIFNPGTNLSNCSDTQDCINSLMPKIK